MESTGVYHQQLAWFVHQQDCLVSILLPNKARHYLMSPGHQSKNEQIDALGLAPLGLQQHLPGWQALSKNSYQLPLLTRQHQRLQALKNHSRNQQHALACSQLTDAFIVTQLDKLIELYDKQAIAKLLLQDEPLRLRAVKGLALLAVATLIAQTNGFTGFDNQRQ